MSARDTLERFVERRLSDFYDAFPIIEKLGMWIIGEDGKDAYFKRNDAEAARTMAALRAVKPEDVSDEMVKTYTEALSETDHGTPYIEACRRAIAAAIAAGA